MGARGSIRMEPIEKTGTPEVELGKLFVEHMRGMGDLYFEFNGVDVVLVSGNLTTAYELKTSISFKVIEQAYRNTQAGLYNYSYIVVPWRGRHFATKICERFGIGVIGYVDQYVGFVEMQAPRLFRHKKTAKNVLQRLKPHHAMALPGTKSGGAYFVSEFSLTCEMLRKYLQRHPGSTLKQAITHINHHYRNNRVAVASLATWIREGKVKGIEKRDGGYYAID